MKQKTEELIEYLYEHNMSQDGYIKVSAFQEKYFNINMLTSIKYIYELFSYVGLNDEQIEKFIIHNLKLLFKPLSEIVKIAYVIKILDMNDELFISEQKIQFISNYKRLFMRNLILKRSNGNQKHYNDYSLLLSLERYTYQELGLMDDIYNIFKVFITTDHELEQLLNNVLVFNGKNVTVDEYLTERSKQFYSEFVNKKRKINKGKQ